MKDGWIGDWTKEYRNKLTRSTVRVQPSRATADVANSSIYGRGYIPSAGQRPEAKNRGQGSGVRDQAMKFDLLDVPLSALLWPLTSGLCCPDP
jgi:hypothetical protein